MRRAWEAWEIRRGTDTVRPLWSDGRTLYVDHNTRTAWIREGQPAWRNNNPGNIWGRDPYFTRGAIGWTCNNFAIFPNHETGLAAAIRLLRDHGNYCAGDNTLSEGLAIWTNDAVGTTVHTRYLNTVVNALNYSGATPAVDGNTRMRDPRIRGHVEQVALAIEVAEGSQEGPAGQFYTDYYSAAYYCYAPPNCMPCNNNWLQQARDHFNSYDGILIPPTDPLVMDLDGNGVQTTNVAGGVHFDHDANGFAEQTGWIGPGDGLLVMDRNGDDIILDGQELFGNETILKNGTRAANGFQALAELDDNHDGKIDAADAAFTRLRVWQDADGDGYSFDELHSLAEFGIGSINLSSTPDATRDQQGNTRTRVGSFEKADGTIAEIAEYSFQRNTTDTIALEILGAPEELWELPQLQGSGDVYDLKTAMVRDSSGQLTSLVEQFVTGTDPNARNALMEQILLKWTGSDGIDPASRGPNIHARKLAVLESFFGEPWVGENGPNPAECGFYAYVA